MFYMLDKGKVTKVVYKNIGQLMCPIVLAHLIMGDVHLPQKLAELAYTLITFHLRNVICLLTPLH